MVESRSDGFAPGDLVQGPVGWRTHPTWSRRRQKLDLSRWVPRGTGWVRRNDGVTAYFGIRESARSARQTVLVSGAAGGVGQIAAQIGRSRHAGRRHRRWRGEDAAADEELAARRHRLQGRTGPAAAIARIALGGRPVLRQRRRSDSGGGSDQPPCRSARRDLRPHFGRPPLANSTASGTSGNLIGKRARMQGFVVFDYRTVPRRAHLARRPLRAGRLRQRLHVSRAWNGHRKRLACCCGKNTGKLVVSVGTPAPQLLGWRRSQAEHEAATSLIWSRLRCRSGIRLCGVCRKVPAPPVRCPLQSGNGGERGAPLPAPCDPPGVTTWQLMHQVCAIFSPCNPRRRHPGREPCRHNQARQPGLLRLQLWMCVCSLRSPLGRQPLAFGEE